MQENETTQTYMIIRDGMLQSLLSTFLNYGSILGLLYFNHQWLSGSTWVDVVFVILALMGVSVRNKKSVHYFNSTKEAKDWLDEQAAKEENV